MPPKHHKRTLRRRCWEQRWNVGKLTALLTVAIPAFQAWHDSRQTPELSDTVHDRTVDVSDLYWKVQDLQKQLDDLKTNRIIKP